MVSLTTDYANVSTGDPSPYLRKIADAGFSRVHWCHQWSTDFYYMESEIERIAAWLKEYGLEVLDLHGSIGIEKCWASPDEYQRLAGVELVKNRLEVCARWGGDVVIMHNGIKSEISPENPVTEPLRRSLDELQPYAKKLGVRIAIENGNWPVIHALLKDYPADFLGHCYDSGHGNSDGVGITEVAKIKDRLISIHLHDNEGTGDAHSVPFHGTVDWDRLTTILAESSYKKCISLESVMRERPEDEFLVDAYQAATRLQEMLDSKRANLA